MDSITTIFREKKLKLTPQRIAVYKFLKSTKEHPSAETIYKALQPSYPTMSLATVYKALKTLVEVKLVQEINLGEGNFRYDGTTTPHSHIQCLNCGKVDDIQDSCLEGLNTKVSECTDYNILYNQVYFYGICKDCSTSEQ
ncbi:transcriptional repressor [Clostridium sp. 19966]|uniref:Fur family transcriptional regulator n=1 Tax=Clostridium sp. 19966 TaxID=2768166 RepID=UPI0028DD4A92|nr:Fur family transcriptional regulator [Clostridium sp. 19966]MDT8719124.1 transcriptional repressor [Clostridium sp. 19966]